MQEAHAEAESTMGKKMKHYKLQYDKTSTSRKIKEGLWVWLHNPTKKVGLSPKLQNQWEEMPYKVIRSTLRFSGGDPTLQ